MEADGVTINSWKLKMKNKSDKKIYIPRLQRHQDSAHPIVNLFIFNIFIFIYSSRGIINLVEGVQHSEEDISDHVIIFN